VAGVVAGINGCGPTQDGLAQSYACPPGERCQTRLTILHTADIHSRLFPYELLITQVDASLGLGPLDSLRKVGGVSRMAYVLQRERARADRVIHVDGGDCFQGAPIFNFFAGEPEIRAQSMLGLDAMVIANHEFDRGVINAANQIQKWASFPVLAANYKFEDSRNAGHTLVGNVIRPFATFNRGGLRISVIGMGNLSSLSSLYEQPNRLGITPLSTYETVQFYVDLLRPVSDVIVLDTHLGLDVDQRTIRNTTGIDVVMGSHNHVVINPPQIERDCTADPNEPGYVWAVDPNLKIDPSKPPPFDEMHPDPVGHPWMFRRRCTPRNVVLAHSGAFAKYVGRLDLVLSNAPRDVSPTGDPADYDEINGFEVVSTQYQAIPIDDTLPEEPRVAEMLEPYRRMLDRIGDLDLLVGYAPTGSRRFSPGGGDSPLGNLVGSAVWLRLGVQTDFSLTNSTGIRQDLLPGPVTVEQMYNIFPFDNSITKMELSGAEVQELFDFVARRSAGRGCTTQVQIAGARVRLQCSGCNREGARAPCTRDEECPGAEPGSCDLRAGRCIVRACAEEVYIGHTEKACTRDDECTDDAGKAHPDACDTALGRCRALIRPTNQYELATSNYIATGGSGFRVLQRNTTQFDTRIQQRDALLDYIRAGRPCGYRRDAGTPEGLLACGTDADCDTGFVCACPDSSTAERTGDALTCKTTNACDPAAGRCVLRSCRDDVARYQARRCAESPEREACEEKLKPCSLGGESCKLLACVDERLGAKSDGRINMVGR
jgi:5'-nucleotidase